MRKKTIVTCALAALCLVAFAREGRQFEPMEYDGLPYQQLACNVKGAKKPSLVIFLHGGHARGNDNQAQIQLPAVRDIKDFILTSNIPAYFLVPQCPSGYEWISSRGRPGCKEKVLGLIRKYADEKGIDKDRIYICSVSMGAWASWGIVQEHPELFAAAFIASGAPKGVSAKRFAGIPLYVTVGSRERTADLLADFTSEIKDAGGTVEFDILSGCSHPEACSKAFTAKTLDWIFSQRKH
jgi:predicted peptidase